MRVNPEMVTLARVSRGFNIKETAVGLGVASATLSRYESGRFSFPENLIDGLSDFLDYPVSFFLQEAVPVQGVGPDTVYHRKRASAGKRLLSRAYALASVRRNEALKLDALFGLPEVPRYPSERYNDPGKVARTIRAKWGVPMGPIFNLTRLLEAKGVVIYPYDFGTRYIDGFTHILGSGLPVVHMNSSLPSDRWRWTLAHELGHLVMHGDFPSDAGDVEKEANLFAAEFLTPGYEIGPSLVNLDESALFRLKAEWGVSMRALIMRAWDLGILADYRRRDLFIWLSKSGYSSREPAHLNPPVEIPSLPGRMVLRCVAERSFDRQGMLDFLCIGERDFRSYYAAGMVSPGADDSLT